MAIMFYEDDYKPTLYLLLCSYTMEILIKHFKVWYHEVRSS